VLVAHDNRCFRAFWCRTTSNDRLGDTHLQPWRIRHTERDHDVTGYDDQGAQGKTIDRLLEVEENKL
jgi:hypothetical protein